MHTIYIARLRPQKTHNLCKPLTEIPPSAMATASQVTPGPASDTSSEVDLEVVFEDLLVTNEGEWIEAHKANLLQLWKLLKQGRSRFNDSYLNGCNFRIFCSFVYRWTENDTDEDDSEADTDMPEEETDAEDQLSETVE